jgi:hypothetical protein
LKYSINSPFEPARPLIISAPNLLISRRDRIEKEINQKYYQPRDQDSHDQDLHHNQDQAEEQDQDSVQHHRFSAGVIYLLTSSVKYSDQLIKMPLAFSGIYCE